MDNSKCAEELANAIIMALVRAQPAIDVDDIDAVPTPYTDGSHSITMKKRAPGGGKVLVRYTVTVSAKVK